MKKSLLTLMMLPILLLTGCITSPYTKDINAEFNAKERRYISAINKSINPVRNAFYVSFEIKNKEAKQAKVAELAGNYTDEQLESIHYRSFIIAQKYCEIKYFYTNIPDTFRVTQTWLGEYTVSAYNPKELNQQLDTEMYCVLARDKYLRIKSNSLLEELNTFDIEETIIWTKIREMRMNIAQKG